MDTHNVRRLRTRLVRTTVTTFLFLSAIAGAASLDSGYFAAGLDEDQVVVAFPDPQPRAYFDDKFVQTAPHTKNLLSNATSVKSRWRLIGVIKGKELYDVFHEIQAFGGEWAIKTVLVQVGPETFRPLFCRETQPGQWPVEATFFSFTGTDLLLVDRYFERARIPGPYGHVLRYRTGKWDIDDFRAHPELFRR